MDTNPRSSSQRSGQAPTPTHRKPAGPVRLLAASPLSLNKKRPQIIGAIPSNSAQQRPPTHGSSIDPEPDSLFSNNNGSSASSLLGTPSNPLVGHAQTIVHPLWGGVVPPSKKKNNKKSKKVVPIDQVTRIVPKPVKHSKEDEACVSSLESYLQSLIRHYVGDLVEVQKRALDFILPFRDCPPKYICDVSRNPGSTGIISVRCILCPKEECIQFPGRNAVRRFAEHFVHHHLHIAEPFVCFKPECRKTFGLPQTRDRHEQDVHYMYRPKAHDKLLKNEESHSPAASPANTEYTSSYYGSTPSHYASTPSVCAPTPAPDLSDEHILPPNPSPTVSTHPLPYETSRPLRLPSKVDKKLRKAQPYQVPPSDARKSSGQGTGPGDVFLAPGPVNPHKGTPLHKRHETSTEMATRAWEHHDQHTRSPSDAQSQMQARWGNNPDHTHQDAGANLFLGQEQPSFPPAPSSQNEGYTSPTAHPTFPMSTVTQVNPVVDFRYLQTWTPAGGPQNPASVNPGIPRYMHASLTVPGDQPTGHGQSMDVVGEDYSILQPRNVVGMRGPNQSAPYPPGYIRHTWPQAVNLAATGHLQASPHVTGQGGMQPGFYHPQSHNTYIHPGQHNPNMPYTHGISQLPYVTGNPMPPLWGAAGQPSPVPFYTSSTSIMQPTRPAHVGGTAAQELTGWVNAHPNAFTNQPSVRPSMNPPFYNGHPSGPPQ
ncbi:hypothetical protein M408DRAFT_22275 [Serendipita vermifera MAFF 305830]|uniref:C2H2-type domain-containing protein n=1 Tax=Serendipita vermifera MAFF 305830 TaxID=933852 RepID=A0A0C2XMR9_SERVB|nr:hypothetical protein M408DRAFT_22275 [Serendipita vermifera MAFF 305830]